ncbi:type VII secretion integral membrane protein EccD [Amycolatopsis samaneae]|uniref:Type VII secretion integral membrane protein EccD n=1 Tax=Amycolatopsis samaneae TaxID=664691 RepID=A0ABW5GRC6_9PSEU
MEERTQHRTSAPGRLRFVLGDTATDVALPAEVPLVDLLPAVLPQFGAEWVEQGADHEGWVVQRLGELPLDEDRTPAELNLMDGEILYLRPRADQFSPIDYDDLVDGVAEQVREDAGTWSPDRTRWMLSLGAVAGLLVALVTLLFDGPALPRCLLAGGVAVVLVVGAGVLARAAGELVIAVLLAAVAPCYAGVSGWLLVLVIDPSAQPVIALTGAAAGVLAALSAGLAVVADAALVFTGALTGVLMLLVFGVVAAVSPADVRQAAAIALVVSLIAGMFVPTTAFRLSGLTLPMLPTNAEELREEIDPVSHRVVVERGAVAVGYTKALHLGLGAAQLVLLFLLVAGGGTFPLILAPTIGLLLFLRSRHLDGAVPRWAMLAPGGFAMAASAVVLALGVEFPARLEMLVLPLLAAGTLLVVLSRRLPGKRLRPYWGRAVDILETLTAIAVLPLTLAVLNVYALVRGMSG